MFKKVKKTFNAEISGALFEDGSMKLKSKIINDGDEDKKECVLNREQVLGVKKFIEFLTSDFN